MHNEVRSHLARFVQALEAEIAFIKKTGDTRKCELSGGKRDPISRGAGGVYTFLLADGGLRMSDDASGTLQGPGMDVRALVVGHEGNRLWLLLESSEVLPHTIPTATLTVSETELLERLKERLLALADSGAWRLVPPVFGCRPARVGSAPLPSHVAQRVGDEAARVALEQALGSDVTFLWGPPGTGKTFSIAALVATLVEAGETVLVTSHTHAAVEQALWALIEPPSPGRDGGLCAMSPHVSEGRILKLGPLRDPKIPLACHFDGRLEQAATALQQLLDELATEKNRIERTFRRARGDLDRWRAHDDASRHVQEAQAALDSAAAAVERALSDVRARKAGVAQRRQVIDAASNSLFFGRKGRVVRAQQALGVATTALVHADALRAETESRLARARLALEVAELTLEQTAADVTELAPRHALEADVRSHTDALEEVLIREDEARSLVSGVADGLLDNARALFVTLTKLFVDRHLQSRSWDTVIIDEASMAMPPLVASAAAFARKRVIVCGDFYQLPPVVHSHEGIAAEELGRDVFDIRGIPAAVEAGTYLPELAMLRVQRRMHPDIAEIARLLVYRLHLVDHPSVVTRAMPPAAREAVWATLASAAVEHEAALAIVDIASLRPWSGKLKGRSLSRFNVVSALVSVELAAHYARRMSRPDPGDPKPVGIITPFTAQRRYLSKLVESFGDLADWVMVGTVHTFQGNECDVIIFDTVVGNPHFGARLADDRDFNDVRRDLNVAVTRARHQFVLVADGEWCDTRAKAGSGLGVLWAHLKRSAPVVDAGRLPPPLQESQGGVPPRNAPERIFDDGCCDAIARDLADAREHVVFFTPTIDPIRWEELAPHIKAVAARGVGVTLFRRVEDSRRASNGNGGLVADTSAEWVDAGVSVIRTSGIAANTIVIDGHIVYEGSLQWGVQRASGHLVRIVSRDLAVLTAQMLQVPDIVTAVGFEDALRCPNCGGRLIVVNLKSQGSFGGRQPMHFACANYYADRKSCRGYMRGVDERMPFRDAPLCRCGEPMTVEWTGTGRPWNWVCSRGRCPKMRWRHGDVGGSDRPRATRRRR